MARRRPNLDLTHRDIAEALEGLGFVVLSLAGVGDGCPDLLVAWGGCMWLVECKTPRASKRNPRGRLRGNLPRSEATGRRQAAWRASWPGPPVVVLESGGQALMWGLSVQAQARKTPLSGVGPEGDRPS